MLTIGRILSCSTAPGTPSVYVDHAATTYNAGTKTIFPFEDLPVELIILVFTLAIDTRPNATRFPYTPLLVSKRWHEIALMASELWKTIDFVCTSALDLPAILSILKRHSSRSRSRLLDIDLTLSRESCSVWVPLLASEGDARWGSLRVRSACGTILLPLLSFASRRLEAEARCFASLETLEIVDDEDEKTSGFMTSKGCVVDWLPHILGGLTRLRKLHVQHISLHRSTGEMPEAATHVAMSLKELCLEDVDAQAMTIFRYVDFPSLETLGIHCRSREAPSEKIIPAGLNLPSLKNVILYGVDQDNATALLSASPIIRNLATSHCPLRNIVDSNLCPRLANLVVHGTTGTWLPDVVKNRLPTIERLSVDHGFGKDSGEAGVSAMDWLKAHVEVELVGRAELGFGPVCRRFSSAPHY